MRASGDWTISPTSRELAKSGFTALSPVAFNSERGAESDYLLGAAHHR